MDFFLYNPLSSKNKGEEIAIGIAKNWEEKSGIKCTLVNQLKLNTNEFISNLDKSDRIIVTGGDGTIHHFANKIKDLNVENDIYFIPSGTGNDFYEDVGKAKEPILINDYIKNLPICKFLDKELVFVNGCGLGMDGYVCYLVNNSNKKKKNSFTKSALKAFIKYKRSNIEIIVDGVSEKFNNVYLASIMNGRYEGGGMMMSPASYRLDDKIEVCVIYGMNKLRFITAFPKVFKGKHLKYKKYVKVLQGKEIIIKAETNLYMQVDGEDFKDITHIVAKKGL